MSGQPRTCDLWISDDCVLTVAVDASLKGFEPEPSHQQAINDTILHLARAIRPCTFAAENDPATDTLLAIKPIEAIATAIIILAQLSAAVQSAIGPQSTEEGS